MQAGGNIDETSNAASLIHPRAGVQDSAVDARRCRPAALLYSAPWRVTVALIQHCLPSYGGDDDGTVQSLRWILTDGGKKANCQTE
jgi:hypothetical protein